VSLGFETAAVDRTRLEGLLRPVTLIQDRHDSFTSFAFSVETRLVVRNAHTSSCHKAGAHAMIAINVSYCALPVVIFVTIVRMSYLGALLRRQVHKFLPRLVESFA
jgi:hypothetical protein